MSCERCDHGWITVGPGYPAWRWPDPAEWPADPETAEVVAQQLTWKRRLAAQDIYPCRNCRPELFARWAGGHLASGHRCGECAEVRRGRRRPATPPESVSVPEPRERRDLL